MNKFLLILSYILIFLGIILLFIFISFLLKNIYNHRFYKKHIDLEFIEEADEINAIEL
jgi:hypothetical protein